MSRTRVVPVVFACALTLSAALSGCATQSASSASKSIAPKPKSTYSTVIELRDAFIAAGGDCPDWQMTNRVKLAAQSGECSGSVVLSTYLSASTRDEVILALKGVSDPGAVHLLVGENWIINTKAPEGLVDKMGGTVVRQ